MQAACCTSAPGSRKLLHRHAADRGAAADIKSSLLASVQPASRTWGRGELGAVRMLAGRGDACSHPKRR